MIPQPAGVLEVQSLLWSENQVQNQSTLLCGLAGEGCQLTLQLPVLYPENWQPGSIVQCVNADVVQRVGRAAFFLGDSFRAGDPLESVTCSSTAPGRHMLVAATPLDPPVYLAMTVSVLS